MEGNLFTVTCPNCQKKFDIQVTSQSQSLVCPFCNFIGQAKFQAPPQFQQPPQQVTQYQQPPQQVIQFQQQPQPEIQFQQQPQPEIQFQQQAQPMAAQPPTQKKSKKSLGILLAVIVVVILVVAGAFYISSTPSSEEENGELEIKRVFHEPQSPGTDDQVDFYAEIVNCPSSYEVEYNVEVYNEGVLGSISEGDMYKATGSEDLWQHAELFTSTGFDSGKEVRFYVEIFDGDSEPSSDPTPIMTSETDSFIIS
jgi:hypothetical protein